jgi:cobalt-zinc-cadmium efflux system outer membrane protein
MDEAVARARVANPDISAARKAIDAAAGSLQRSKAWLPSNPYVSGGAGTTTQQGVGSNYGLYLSQEIEVAGQRSKRVEAAARGLEKATAEAAAAEQTLVATVKTAFIQALTGSERVTLVRQGLETAAELTNRLGQHKASSEVQRLNLNNARIQESRLRREVAATQHALEIARHTVRRLLGLPIEQDVALVGIPLCQARPLPAEAELIARALRQRADLIAQQRALQQAESQIALVRREAIPNVTLSGNFSRFQGETLGGGDVGVQLPIFQRKTPDVIEALAERDRAKLQLQGLEQTIQQETVAARRACEVAAADLQALTDEVLPRSEENVEIERRRYERGDATLAELVTARLELLATRREHVDSVQTYNETLIDLERVSGGGLD